MIATRLEARDVAAAASDASRRRAWLNASRRVPVSWLLVKRVTDVLGSIAGLIVALPLFLVVAVAIKWCSRGPVFFTQTRVGKNGRPFALHKFRTMIDGAHLLHETVAHLNDCDGPALKIERDPRLHVLGRFLRRTSLDELPQLVNVLRGEMSLVGPRPALPSEVDDYQPHYLQRLTVTPGLTGLWQVSGRANVPFRRWMAMDVWYATHWSPALDLSILARTIPAVIRREGAW